MVCIRCKMVVADELIKLGIHPVRTELGEVELAEAITAGETALLQVALRRWGLELMDDRKSMLIEKIKNVVIESVHYAEEPLQNNFSKHLSEKLHYDYTYLANLFSEVQGITIEHFIICHRIERVKELLMYNELNLTEIAWKLHYSSVSHLSRQFRKVSGLTPTDFRRLKEQRRSMLEDI